MKDTYITAVLEMIEEGTDPLTILSGLQTTLKQHGHERLYASVLRGVLRVISAGSAETVTVAVATENDFKKYEATITTALKELAAEGMPVVQVDESLIGGYVLEANNQRVDASYKSKLVSLYRNITK